MKSKLPNYMTKTSLSQDLENPGVKTKIADTTLLNAKSSVNYSFPFRTMNSIEGIPYQFMETVDRRIRSSYQEFGRKYSQKVLAQLPILFMMPCRPSFMSGYDENEKQNVLEKLVDESSSYDPDKFLTTKIGGMYYSVRFAYDQYYSYLNKMIQSVAGYMGLGDETINLSGKGAADRQPLKNYNWGTVAKFNDKIFSSAESVAFFVDGLNTIDTSFSNDTRQSTLAGTINNYSDMANEINFLLGSDDSAASYLKDFAENAADSIGDSVSSLVNGLAGGLLASLSANGPESIINGGKIIFPEIWSDSEHSESYSFTVKLRSPDHDSLSILLNILVPYCKILAMTMPQTIDGNPNGYKSPFLVKAYCKGLFNIDMGIIDSLQVSKGAECMWNDDGLPTQIDINFSIKNLYSSLAMSGSNDSIKNLTVNTAYMDFLANMAGCNVMMKNHTADGKVNTALYELDRRISISNNINKLYNTISNRTSRAIMSLYDRL